MPTYDYYCSKCGTFEHFQSITSTPIEKCPECGSGVKKMVTSCAGLVFKGSGFYETDYKRAKPAAPTAKTTTEAPQATANVDTVSQNITKTL